MDPIWTLDDEARSVADTVYLDHLRPINLSAFTEGLLVDRGQSPLLPGRQEREIYSDTVYDLHRLLEEVRFEVGLAAMLLGDFQIRRDRGELDLHNEPETNTTPSVELLAAFAAHSPPPPPPSLLTHDLHRTMVGGRYLSSWLAGQLLDSAILRALSCMDRVATILHLRAGLPIDKRRDGSLHLPSYNRGELCKLQPHYKGHAAWDDLHAVHDHPIYALIKRFRDGNVHRRRWPSELHGESRLTYWDGGAPPEARPSPEKAYAGTSAHTHLALLVAAWANVLQPTIDAGGRLLGAGKPDPAGEERQADTAASRTPRGCRKGRTRTGS